MLRIEFNAENINKFLEDNLKEEIELPNNFLNIDSDLEKLNMLKTEFSHALKDFRISDSEMFIEVFDHLQAGEYIILNQNGDLVYEGYSFKELANNTSVISESKQDKETNMESMTIIELLEERQNLEQKLSAVNAHIVNNLTSSLDLFDDVINRVEELKLTWAERIDNMLSLEENMSKDDLTAFSEMMTSLKAVNDKLSSNVF